MSISQHAARTESSPPSDAEFDEAEAGEEDDNMTLYCGNGSVLNRV